SAVPGSGIGFGTSVESNVDGEQLPDAVAARTGTAMNATITAQAATMRPPGPPPAAMGTPLRRLFSGPASDATPFPMTDAAGSFPAPVCSPRGEQAGAVPGADLGSGPRAPVRRSRARPAGG